MARAGIQLQEEGEDEEDEPSAGVSPAAADEERLADPQDLSAAGLLKHLKAELKKAVDEERYEDAAALRDKIGKVSSATR